jgi:hypothetical protein
MVGNQAVQGILAQKRAAAGASNVAPVITPQSSPRIMRSVDDAPDRVVKHGAPGNRIQRNWKESIKSFFTKNRNPRGYDRGRVPTTASTALEAGKPTTALGVSGATLGGVEGGITGAGTPAGVGMLNFLTAADAALTWRSGNKRYEEAMLNKDEAGMKLGTRKANQGKWAMAGGVAGTVQGGLNLGSVLDVGSHGLMSASDLISGTNYISTGLGVAGAAAGIAGGAITAGQGLWKSGKAISKLYKLSKSAPMLTDDGDRWRARIKDREKTKLGLNALKTIAGILGIAAGALVIVSNPVGWALGIAAAATVGGLAAYKFYTKYKKSKRKQNAKRSVREEMEQEQRQDEMPQLEEIPQPEEAPPPRWKPPLPPGPRPQRLQGQELGQHRLQQEPQPQQEEPPPRYKPPLPPGPRPQPVPRVEEPGQYDDMPPLEDIPQEDEAGMVGAQPAQLDNAKRKQAVELGNRIAQKVSKSGKVASEIRGALANRQDPMVPMLLSTLKGGSAGMTHAELRAYNKDKDYPFPQRILKTHDALVMLSVLNLTPEQVEAESGQELIEKKLSVSDSL